MRIRCPVCGKYKYWDYNYFKYSDKYIQCQNCWSIINKVKLLERLKRGQDEEI